MIITGPINPPRINFLAVLETISPEHTRIRKLRLTPERQKILEDMWEEQCLKWIDSDFVADELAKVQKRQEEKAKTPAQYDLLPPGFTCQDCLRFQKCKTKQYVAPTSTVCIYEICIFIPTRKRVDDRAEKSAGESPHATPLKENVGDCGLDKGDAEEPPLSSLPTSIECERQNCGGTMVITIAEGKSFYECGNPHCTEAGGRRHFIPAHVVAKKLYDKRQAAIQRMGEPPVDPRVMANSGSPPVADNTPTKSENDGPGVDNAGEACLAPTNEK